MKEGEPGADELPDEPDAEPEGGRLEDGKLEEGALMRRKLLWNRLR